MATTDFVVKNGLVVTENAVINETTDATNKDSGALVVEGGVGIEKKLYVGTDLNVGGATTLTGDLAVNGGDLTTSSATASLFNTTATTVNIAGAATDVQIGAATGTTEINNNLNVVGDVDIDGGDLTASTASFNLLNATVTTLNVGGAATTVNAGAAGSAGTFTIKNDNTVVDGDLQVKGGDLTTSQATFNLLNTTATTVNFAGAATDLQIGAATGTTEINNNLNVVGDVDIDGGDLTVSTATFNLANTTATTINFGGAATDIQIGAATGTTNINNNLDVDGDINIDGGDLTVSTGTFNLVNTTATTVNFAGAGTAISIGSATGTTTINNANTVVTGDLAVNGADITTTSTGTATVFNANATTLNMGQAATTVSIGATTGTTTIRNSLAVNGNATIGDASGDTVTINSSSVSVPNTLTFTVDDAVTNNVSYPIKLTHTTSGTPANGIGTGIQFITETSAGNNEIGSAIESIAAVTNSTLESFDLVFKTMSVGATATAKVWIKGDGKVGFGVSDPEQNVEIYGGNYTKLLLTADTENGLKYVTSDGYYISEFFNSYGNIGIQVYQSDPNLANKQTGFYPFYYYAGGSNASNAYTRFDVNGTEMLRLAANGLVTVSDALTVNGNTTLGNATSDTVTITATVQPGVVISGSSAGDALRITQTGAGNALLVEDETNADATPFVVTATGAVGVGRLSPSAKLHVANDLAQTIISQSITTPLIQFWRSNGTIASPTTVADTNGLGALEFGGHDGAGFRGSAYVSAFVEGTVSSLRVPSRLVFSTTAQGGLAPTEALRIDNAQRIGIGSTPSAYQSVSIGRTLTGQTFVDNITIGGNAASDVTGAARGVQSQVTTTAATFTLSAIQHFYANPAAKGAGSTITNQYGFYAESSLTTATNNYGFYSNIASGSGRWGFYSNGTAANVFAGTTSLGGLQGAESLRATPVASAVNYVNVLGAATGNAVQLEALGTDTNIWINYETKGTGVHQFITDGQGTPATQFRINHTASAVNYLEVTGNITTNAPIISAQGADTNISLVYRTKNTGGHYFQTAGNNQFAVVNTASAVDFLQATGSASGFPQLSASGTSTNITMVYTSKGAGSHSFNTGSNNLQFNIANTASAANYLQVTGGATGTGATLSAQGSDTNVNIRLAPKGTGTVQELYNGTYYDIVSQFDIGTNANQIPLNQYLGTLAYQNADNTTIGTLAVTGTTSLGTSNANYLSVTGAASGSPVNITTAGSDTNIGLTITTKGTGAIIIDTGPTSGEIDLKPGASPVRIWDDDSSHYYSIVTGNQSANYTLTLAAGNTTLVAGTMITSSGGTFTGQLISTLANNAADGGGQLYLNGATGNRIDFNQNGVAAPAFTTRSAGTKLTLYPAVGAASTDYAIGIENNNLWFSTSTTSTGFKWYGGTTQAATLTGAGALTLTSNLTVSGGTITTGNVAATLLGGNTTTNITLGSGLTSGTFTLGGTATTGTITIDQSNSAHTLNIATGTNATGVTKTINIGTGGAAGSTTNITLGSSAGGGSIVANEIITSGVGAGNLGLDLSTSDAYASFRIVRNSGTANTDGLYLGYANSGSATTKLYGGGSTTVTMTIAAAATASTSTTTGAVIIAGGVGISGALNATTKSFDIEHPTKPGQRLRHGSLEGPEFGVYVRGRLNGSNVIELPDYWTGLVDPDSITVNLTSIGRHQHLFVESIENNQVVVGIDSVMGDAINCFYTVFAERKDVDKIVVEE